MATAVAKEEQVLDHLYDFYNPEGKDSRSPIYIKFSTGINVENGDIDDARTFATRIRLQLGDVADVSQRNSTVLIQPKV